MRSNENISLVLTTLLTLVGVFALLRAVQTEFYVLAITGISLIAALGLVGGRTGTFLYAVFVSYELICLSWALASNFQMLLRDDVYHYYPFTRYVHETRHFSYPGGGRRLKKYFSA